MKKHRKSSKKQLSKKIGMPPGALVYVGDMDADIAKMPKPTVMMMVSAANDVTEKVLSAEDLATFKISDYTDAGKKIWLNVHGVHDAELIKQIGDLFHLHPLVQEDILNTEQRPKIDEFKEYIFLEARSFQYDKAPISVELDCDKYQQPGEEKKNAEGNF